MLLQPEANDVPEAFVTMWQEACATNAKAMTKRLSHGVRQAVKSALFNKWLAAGGDYSR